MAIPGNAKCSIVRAHSDPAGALKLRRSMVSALGTACLGLSPIRIRLRRSLPANPPPTSLNILLPMILVMTFNLHGARLPRDLNVGVGVIGEIPSRSIPIPRDIVGKCAPEFLANVLVGVDSPRVAALKRTSDNCFVANFWEQSFLDQGTRRGGYPHQQPKRSLAWPNWCFRTGSAFRRSMAYRPPNTG